MVIAAWYAGIMALYLVALYVDQKFHILRAIGTGVRILAGRTWSAMMRHTGESQYTYVPRRYR